jgi:hypothetical protein
MGPLNVLPSLWTVHGAVGAPVTTDYASHWSLAGYVPRSW